MFLPLRPEDENGEELNFNTLDAAKAYIDKYIIPKNFIYLKNYDDCLIFSIGNYKYTNNKLLVSTICDKYYFSIIEKNMCEKCTAYSLCEKVFDKNVCNLNKTIYNIYSNLIVNVSKNVTNER